jgi:uncharacterized membrane-anchored protein
MMINLKKILGVVAVLFCCVMNAVAQEKGMTEGERAWQEGYKYMIQKSGLVPLGEKADMNLPEGYGFIPSAQAIAIQKSMGNSAGENMLGMVISLDSNSSWFVTLEYDETDHIKDDDQSELKPDEILTSIKEGQEEDNKRRKEEGYAELDILGWVEVPSYNPKLHQLLWSLELADKGSKESNVNYNVKCLSRTGMITLTFVGTKVDIQNNLVFAKNLSAGVAFKEGHRYTDFNSATDKVAEYGLLGLIGGGLILKKLGLFALIGVFFMKFIKIFLVGFLVFGAWFKKFFTRKKAEKAAATEQEALQNSPINLTKTESTEKDDK